jgi:F0F1-type ATP synthase assembly protein I
MSQEKNKKAIGVAISLGFELLSLVLICIFLGYYLGRMKGFAEMGAVVGSVLGFTLWTWRLIRSKKYLL